MDLVIICESCKNEFAADVEALEETQCKICHTHGIVIPETEKLMMI